MLSPRLDAAKAVLVLAVWWSTEATALAHPHIFGEATSTIELDEQDRIARIRHEWTFDPLFSSWLSQGIDRDGEGRLDSGRLDEIGRGDVENLHAYGYYTSVLNDGASLAFVADGPVTLSEDDGRLQLRFAIVPEQEIPSQGRLSVSVFDPQYYTAISFAASEGVKIAGDSGACDMAHEEGQALPDSVQTRLRQLPANVYQLPPEQEPFDLAALGDSVLARHLFVEACRLAFADRDLYLADSDFVSIPQGLLDPAYLVARAALIDPDRSMGTARPGVPPWSEPVSRIEGAQPPENGTTHFVIVDGSGNMVSATTTIETSLGNRVMAAGFLLNNELTDFSFRPGTPEQPVANAVEPGKRPRSSMAPTIVFADGRPILLTGSPGGAEIIPYTAFSIIAVLDWGMDPQHAIDLPLITNLNGTIFVERGEHAEALASALRQKGHEVAIVDLNSGLHLIAISDNAYIGAADKRRDGRAMGR